MTDTFAGWTLLAADAADEVAEATEAAESSGLSGFSLFFLVVLLVVGPFVIGIALANALKLKEYGTKIGFALFATVLALTPFVNAEMSESGWRDAFRLGIDLAGGTNLQYQIDVEAAAAQGKIVDSQTVDQMVGAITKRINPSGTEEVTVRAVGTDRIEVIIPGADQDTVNEKKDAMTRLGSLELEILATSRDNKHRHRVLIDRAEQLADDEKNVVLDDRVSAAWRPITEGKEDKIGGGGTLTREVDAEDGAGKVTEVLVVLAKEKDKVSGDFLTRAFPTSDRSMRPAVGFNFGSAGANRMNRLTATHLPMQDDSKYQLAIILDGVVTSAPSINAAISDSGIIEGDFTQAEVRALVDVLNAGALEVPLIQEPISEFTQSPLLGADIQEKGMNAIGIAAVAVFVFMLIYYRFAGVVADLGLLLNLVLVLGLMSIIEAAFTLPGLAGLVLTIGMAVDANVLIFERIREEQTRGSSLRMSVQNGFSRALTTIVDANVTTLIVACVLYMIGTDQVKGFAVTLFVGIVMSMYSSLGFGRMVFEICEKKRWLKDLTMGSIVKSTHWDFVARKGTAAVVSLVVIVAGLLALFSRGSDNLDIDFNGGTMVTLLFEEGKQPSGIDVVREHLTQGDDGFEKSITIETLQIEGEGSAELYRMRTTNADVEEVGRKIAAAFDDSEYVLQKKIVSFGELKTIEAPEEPAGEEDKAAADDAEAGVRFAGGNEVPMTFNAETLGTVVASNFENALKEVNGEKYAAISESIVVDVIKLDADGQPIEDAKRSKELVLRTSSDIGQDDLRKAMDVVQAKLATEPNFQDINKFASSVAGEMQTSALAAMLVSLVAIVLYIWVRFQKITFGLAAVAALVHDVLCVVGAVAIAAWLSGTAVGPALMLVDFKINLPMIAAFLTIVGYSLNDTIVVFDRIREVRGKNPDLTSEMVNTSLNQTLSRTLLTSLTTLIVVLILYVIGGEGIHGFAFALVIGVLVGTYSSIYVASPVLLWLMNRDRAVAAR